MRPDSRADRGAYARRPNFGSRGRRQRPQALTAARARGHGSPLKFPLEKGTHERESSHKDAGRQGAPGEVNAGHLRAFIERIERLEEEKKALADDIKDVYAEAKGNGFDAKIMRKIVSIRKQDREKRREEENILDLYLAALGIG